MDAMRPDRSLGPVRSPLESQPKARRYLLPALLTAVLVVGSGANKPPKPKATSRTCAQTAWQFRELLEPVVEASIDGHPDQAGTAAARVQGWWKRHHGEIRLRASTDSLVPALARAGSEGRALEAARLAVLLTEQTYGWCGRPPVLVDQVLRIDLAGQTAWLRAQGVNIPWADETPGAASSVEAELRTQGHEALADSLESALRAATETPVAERGDAGPALHLLDLVDRVESALR
jgi:hypothetical protein